MKRFFDWWLELRITAVKRLVSVAKTPTARRLFVGVLYDLIDQRSPEQQARMERERGLA